MAAWAASPPFSTIEMSRATEALSPARAPSTSTSGSYVRATKRALDGFDAGHAGDPVLQDPLHPALERQPGDRAGVAGAGQLDLNDAVVVDAEVLDVAPVHLQSRPDGVDGFEDRRFHNRRAYRPLTPDRSPGRRRRPAPPANRADRDSRGRRGRCRGPRFRRRRPARPAPAP